MNQSVLFLSPAKTVALDQRGAPVQKLRANVSLPAMTILGALEAADREVDFMDMAAEGWCHRWSASAHLIAFGLPVEAALQRIAETNPGYVLITSMFTFEQVMVDNLISAIKSTYPNLCVILGGIHATARPEWHFETSAPDFIVIGEGEETIVELLAELEKPHPCSENIRGLVFRGSDGNLIRTPPRGVLTQIDRQWALKEILFTPHRSHRYLDHHTRKSPVYAADQLGDHVPSFAFYGSRGCPFACFYCATNRRDGSKVRHMGAERMFHDFQMARQELKAAAFYNQADTFGLHSEDQRFLKMVGDYRRESGDKDFVINNPNAFFLRLFFLPDKDYQINEPLVDLLVAAGINVVTLAIETFTQRFNRKVDFTKIVPEKVFELCQYLKDKGIRTDVYMIYGFPGQEETEFAYDIAMGQRLATIVSSVSWHFLTLLPGTKYYDDAIANRSMSEGSYRQAFLKGYSFFYPVDEFNFSKIPTNLLKAAVADFGPAWI